MDRIPEAYGSDGWWAAIEYPPWYLPSVPNYALHILGEGMSRGTGSRMERT